ncbi:SRPBCC domain-containing protein [Agilicoccus flavus]|uniref:SRPBCC domain-containing protein n=1 Tax=Agilicoccus flavus TaxID=2775968 RepID=UPI001CF6CD91|nr:SRPBCC domain-containing protein [Agilicoccus flavus]
MSDVTARREPIDGAEHLAWTRTFAAPIDDVWAAVTEPERMERWIGTWEGDPASGRVTFRMTAEGEDAPPEPTVIDVCEPPTRLRVHIDADGPSSAWTLDLALSEERGVTTLRFAQLLTADVPVDMVGPGWEYYLDRLAAVFGGRDVAEVAWSDYEPLMADYSRRVG